MKFTEFKANVEHNFKERFDKIGEQEMKGHAIEEIANYIKAENAIRRSVDLCDVVVYTVAAAHQSGEDVANFMDVDFEIKPDYLAGAAYNIIRGRYSRALKYLHALADSELEYKFEDHLDHF